MDIERLNIYERLRDFKVPATILDNIFSDEKDITVLENAYNALLEISFNHIMGDVNQDNNIDIFDIISTISHIIGSQTISGVSFFAADMNSDEIVNIQDIILIVDIIL